MRMWRERSVRNINKPERRWHFHGNQPPARSVQMALSRRFRAFAASCDIFGVILRVRVAIWNLEQGKVLKRPRGSSRDRGHFRADRQMADRVQLWSRRRRGIGCDSLFGASCVALGNDGNEVVAIISGIRATPAITTSSRPGQRSFRLLVAISERDLFLNELPDDWVLPKATLQRDRIAGIRPTASK
jgi:hypothetical protein